MTKYIIFATDQYGRVYKIDESYMKEEAISYLEEIKHLTKVIRNNRVFEVDKTDVTVSL